MADILIRMEMPKHCIDCPCMVDKYGGDNCCLQSEEANEKITSWDDMKAGCPLVELPEHGDLIDRDALIRNLLPMQTNPRFQRIKRGFAKAIAVAKDLLVIVPADKEESK